MDRGEQPALFHHDGEGLFARPGQHGVARRPGLAEMTLND